MVSTQRSIVRSRTLWACFVALWLAATCISTAKLEIFASTPGAAATTASSFAGFRYHVYAFLHPDCPCSTATVAELQRAVERASEPVDVTAIIDTAGLSRDDARPLTASIATTPGIAVEVDTNGARTAAFGAKTSGEVLVYDPAGNLAFSGGVTAERGHQGDNSGASAVVSILTGQPPFTRHTPTYGCALSPAEVAK